MAETLRDAAASRRRARPKGGASYHLLCLLVRLVSFAAAACCRWSLCLPDPSSRRGRTPTSSLTFPAVTAPLAVSQCLPEHPRAGLSLRRRDGRIPVVAGTERDTDRPTSLDDAAQHAEAPLRRCTSVSLLQSEASPGSAMRESGSKAERVHFGERVPRRARQHRAIGLYIARNGGGRRIRSGQSKRPTARRKP